MERILITGATGTIGSHIVKEFDDRGITVRAGVRNLEKAKRLNSPFIKFTHFDYTDPGTFDSALDGIEKVFILNPMMNGFEFSRKFIEQATIKGVKHFVKLSALDVDKEPKILAKEGHYMEEKYVADSGVPYTFLRPNHFMQNYLRFAEPIKREGKFFMSTGRGQVSYIDARDIASVAVAVLTGGDHDNKTYSLTGNESLSNFEVAEIMSRVLDKEVQYIDMPDEAAKGGMQRSGMPDEMINAMSQMQKATRENHFSVICPDVKNLLQRDPISFAQFLEDHKGVFSALEIVR